MGIGGEARFLGSPPATRDESWIARIWIVHRLLFRGLLPGGVPRLFHFLRSIPFAKPRFIPLVIQDWIVGLSMREYAERDFGERIDELRTVARSRVVRAERSLRRYVQRGTLEVSLAEAKDRVSNLSVSMRGWLDRRFFTRAERHAETRGGHAVAQHYPARVPHGYHWTSS